jgi:hypothetical protein
MKLSVHVSLSTNNGSCDIPAATSSADGPACVDIQLEQADARVFSVGQYTRVAVTGLCVVLDSILLVVHLLHVKVLRCSLFWMWTRIAVLCVLVITDGNPDVLGITLQWILINLIALVCKLGPSCSWVMTLWLCTCRIKLGFDAVSGVHPKCRPDTFMLKPIGVASQSAFWPWPLHSLSDFFVV